MSYFTTAIAFGAGAWHSYDISIDEYSSPDELAQDILGLAPREALGLALIEHEDEWFAVVRCEGDTDPVLFVSDVVAASHSSYAGLLEDALDQAVSIDLTGGEPGFSDGGDATVPGNGEGAEVGAAAHRGVGLGTDAERATGNGLAGAGVAGGASPVPGGGESAVTNVSATSPAVTKVQWGGDPAVLEPFGVSASDFLTAVTDYEGDPSATLAVLGESLGVSDLLDGLR